jgi:hypothetical protein
LPKLKLLNVSKLKPGFEGKSKMIKPESSINLEALKPNQNLKVEQTP